MDILPSAREINPIPECLDGRYAEEHFLGKDLDGAVTLFADNFLRYQEDLMSMGPVAFKFYIRAAIDYAESDEARFDCDIARTVVLLLDHKWHYEAGHVADLRELFLGYAERLIERMSSMDFQSEIDHRLKRKVERLIAKINNT